jgi:FMN-dependent NADH-azoreductase
MTSLLAINASPRYEHSTSRKLTSLFMEKWRAAHPGGEVVERDLIKTTLPFVDLPWIGGAFTRVGVTVVDNVGQLTGKKATVILASGGDFSRGSPLQAYNHASGYLRHVLGFLGITELDIVLAGAARAGMAGETAAEEFGDLVALAAAA